jgi:hypothetical protein
MGEIMKASAMVLIYPLGYQKSHSEHFGGPLEEFKQAVHPEVSKGEPETPPI